MQAIGPEKRTTEFYMRMNYSILLHEVQDEGKKYWIAEVPELPGCKSHGSSIEEALKNIEEAKKEWIEDSLEQNENVPIPIDREKFGGRILVRMSRSLHRSLSLIAESEKLSLNQLIVTVIAKEVGRLGVLNRAEQKLDRLLAKFDDVLEEKGDVFSRGAAGPQLAGEQYGPAVRALDLIIDEAVKNRASDIHIEPAEDRLNVRFRIGGVLHPVVSLPMSAHAPLIARVKILANMNIAKHSRQEGQFSMTIQGKELEIAAVIDLTANGETALLRPSQAVPWSSKEREMLEEQLSKMLSGGKK